MISYQSSVQKSPAPILKPHQLNWWHRLNCFYFFLAIEYAWKVNTLYIIKCKEGIENVIETEYFVAKNTYTLYYQLLV